MFVCKQVKSFVHSKSVYSVFRDCIYEVTRANSTQISFSIPEISPKKCVAHLKLNLLCSRMNAKDFSLISISKSFIASQLLLLKNCLLPSLQSLHLCIPQQLLQREMFCIQVVA